MAEQEIDITPVESGGVGSKGRKTTVFQETEIHQITENPGNLTKEGVQKKLELWKQSNNKHNQLKYQHMLKVCRRFADSGMTADGKVIYSRLPNGRPKWVGRAEEEYIEEKKEPKKSKK